MIKRINTQKPNMAPGAVRELKCLHTHNLTRAIMFDVLTGGEVDPSTSLNLPPVVLDYLQRAKGTVSAAIVSWLTKSCPAWLRQAKNLAMTTTGLVEMKGERDVVVETQRALITKHASAHAGVLARLAAVEAAQQRGNAAAYKLGGHVIPRVIKPDKPAMDFAACTQHQIDTYGAIVDLEQPVSCFRHQDAAEDPVHKGDVPLRLPGDSPTRHAKSC